MKIADFGLSASGEVDRLTKFVGTPYYMPPEIMQLRKDHESKRSLVPYDGKKADVFSLGVMLSIFVMGIPLFHNADANTDSNFALIAEG